MRKAYTIESLARKNSQTYILYFSKKENKSSIGKTLKIYIKKNTYLKAIKIEFNLNVKKMEKHLE